MRIQTREDLKALREEAKKKLELREWSQDNTTGQCCGISSGTPHMQILTCGGTGCHASGSDHLFQLLSDEVAKSGLSEKVDVVCTGCFGFCEKGPIVKVIPDNTFYTQVREEDVEEIVREHIVGGKRVDRLLYTDPESGQHISDSKHMNFYRKQMRVALRNCGFIDPENINEYIARDGYMALADSLLDRKPEDVVDIIERSGLRGRGGGGFPTGRKWRLTARSQADVKYVVCNADEGDPGAFMDRSIMEGDPNSIVEAMTLCGYAIGAHHGLIYIRAEYPLAIHRLQVAIKQATELGLLGDNLFGTDFLFIFVLCYGA